MLPPTRSRASVTNRRRATAPCLVSRAWAMHSPLTPAPTTTTSSSPSLASSTELAGRAAATARTESRARRAGATAQLRPPLALAHCPGALPRRTCATEGDAHECMAQREERSVRSLQRSVRCDTTRMETCAATTPLRLRIVCVLQKLNSVSQEGLAESSQRRQRLPGRCTGWQFKKVLNTFLFWRARRQRAPRAP